MSLIANLQLLTQSEWDCKVSASHTIYYKKYPYKISFKSNYPRTKRGLYRKPKRSEVYAHSAEILSAMEHCAEECVFKVDRGYRQGISHIYLSDFTDAILIAAAFGDRVVVVTGPVSSEHVDLLKSGNIKCVPKKKLWKNKYNCKVESWIFWRDRQKTSSSDLLDFLSTSIDIELISQSPSDWRTSFYCDFDQFVQVQPFIKLSQSGAHNLHIYKCITE